MINSRCARNFLVAWPYSHGVRLHVGMYLPDERRTTTFSPKGCHEPDVKASYLQYLRSLCSEVPDALLSHVL